MGKYQANLPSVLNPVGDLCVNVMIPNHPDYIKLFLRAIRMLEVNRMYERDEALSAKIVCEQWRDRTVNPLIEALATGTGSCGVDGECLAYPPFASFISYFPQNPYTDPDLIPDGFEQPPFYVNGKDASHDLPNYQDGDVIVDFGSINLEPSWDLAKTPRIELCLTGSGVAEIHFLNIVQGGVAVISLDNPVDLGDLIAGIAGDGIDTIDLNQDIVSLPPETTEEIIIEVEVPTEGDHIIYIYFLPTVNDSLIPLAFGGALREISLCGNLRPCGTPPPEPPPPLDGVSELKPQFRFTAQCGMEYRLLDQDNNIVQDWQGVEGWVDNAALCFGGGDMATGEEIKEAICEGIVCATKEIGKILASGVQTNITVNEDGSVTVGGGTSGETGGLPSDDPATPAINENLAAKAGGVNGVVRGYNLIWTDMNAWKSAAVSTADMIFRLKNKYMMNDDPLTEQFVVAYETAWPSKVNSFTSSLDGMLFCGIGNYKNIVANYIISSISSPLQAEAFALNNAISDEQITVWYEKGAEVPSTAYETFSCVKIQDETLNFDMSGANDVQITTAETWKVNHRMLVDAVGSFVDADVPNVIYDAMWEINTVTGVKTFKPITFNFPGGVTAPTQAQVPYRSDHHYQYTVEKTGSNSAGIVTVVNGTATIPNVTGTVTITFKDQGEIVS